MSRQPQTRPQTRPPSLVAARPWLAVASLSVDRTFESPARGSAYGNNLDLVAQGIGFRKQTAALLGYPSWAHFVIERRMAGTPETVTAFLGKMTELAKDGAAADIERLRKAKQDHLASRGELPEGGADAVRLEAWDSSFYHDQSKLVMDLTRGRQPQHYALPSPVAQPRVA